MTLAVLSDPEQTTDRNAALGSNTATSRVNGTAVGADYRFLLFTSSRLCAARRRHQLSLANGLGSRPSDSIAAASAPSRYLSRRQSPQQSGTLQKKPPVTSGTFYCARKDACLLKVCSASNRSVRLCLLIIQLYLGLVSKTAFNSEL
jgi:hypothetical protein